MKILFKQDGSIGIIELSTFIQQNNHNVDKIFVAVENLLPSDYTCDAFFKLPDGSTNVIHVSETETTMISGQDGITGYYFYLTNAQTVYAGVLEMSLKVSTDSNHDLFTYKTKFTINATDTLPSEVNITLAEYNSLVEAINQVTYPQLVWGNILGTLSNQTDLYNALLDRVSKTTETSKLYGTNASGEQTIYPISLNIVGNVVPLRKSSGAISVPENPSDNTDAASKKYVDDVREIAEGKTTSYIISVVDNPAFNTEDEYIENVNSIRDVNGNLILVGSMKTGDIIYVVETGIPDRWYSRDNSRLYIFDTEQPDLSVYYTKTETDTLLSGKQATLSTAQQNAVDSGITSAKVTTYDTHVADTVIHVTSGDKTAWNGHIADTVIHVTSNDKSAWNGHIADTTIHVTSSDKSTWNDHVANTTIHVTASDKTTWNGKSVVSASASGTSQTPIAYITIDGVEYAIASQVPGTVYWTGVVGLRQNLIEKVNSLPTPTADTSDFVEESAGQLYYKSSDRAGAGLTDLTNTTWIIKNSGLQSITGGATFNINFTSNSTNYTSMVFSSPYISWSLSYDNTQVYGGIPVVWADQAYRTITIIGGTDATNVQLINWLIDNAEYQGVIYNYKKVTTIYKHVVTVTFYSTPYELVIFNNDPSRIEKGALSSDQCISNLSMAIRNSIKAQYLNAVILYCQAYAKTTDEYIAFYYVSGVEGGTGSISVFNHTNITAMTDVVTEL